MTRADAAEDGRQDSDGQSYPDSVVAAGVLATLFFPLVSLIAALILLGSQRVEARRRQLRRWAWASVGWIAIQVLIFVLLFVAFLAGSSSTQPNVVGTCVGGPELGAPATADRNGRAVVPSVLGGSMTITVP